MINDIPETYSTPIYLFHQGTNFMAYDFLGCHKGEKDGRQGHYFRVWAQNAKAVSIFAALNAAAAKDTFGSISYQAGCKTVDMNF